MLGANHLLQEGMTQLPHSLSLALRLNQIRLLQIHQGAIAVRLQTLHQQARFLLKQGLIIPLLVRWYTVQEHTEINLLDLLGRF